MPIITDNNQVSIVDAKGNAKNNKDDYSQYSPKFFHQTVLTGRGGQTKGLLNETRDPKMFKNGYTIIDRYMEPSVAYNQNKKITNIPFYIINPDGWAYINKMPYPALDSMTKIADNGTAEVYLTMPVHAMTVEEGEQQVNIMADTTDTGKSTVITNTVTQKTRDIHVAMHMFLFKISKKSTVKTCTRTEGVADLLTSRGNCYYEEIISDIFQPLRYIEQEMTINNYKTDKVAMNDFVQNYSLYEEICKASKRWLTEISYYLVDLLMTNIQNGGYTSVWYDTYNFSVFDNLSYIEKFTVPLDQYQQMYQKMEKLIPADILAQICKANLNLRLSNTLQHMNANKNMLPSCPNNVHVTTAIKYSSEQTNAIESTSPLTLVQSGAGTGKSTVILGRIDHMIANGVDPKDITVLSFTNAAANHINDLKPSVHSMTIATMLHTIYSANYPTHQLSSLATIINSIDIYYLKSTQPLTKDEEKFLMNFKLRLERLMSNNEFTKMNNFVEDHLDQVINVLNTIGQTSLELESIICYQKMDTLNEPDATKTKHLIIDEVQDNSIAEFIYTIRYVDKHQCSMYIVGDCSQTLYEFRASNPKALNVLEASGVFQTYKLQTNYRSNQEILDFANVLLGNIEANQYANIQLKANSLKPVTSKSFKNAVTMTYYLMNNKSPQTYDDMYAHSVAVDTYDYINDKLNKGEQVCILAPARRTLYAVQTYLKRIYPGRKIASLIPTRLYDNTIFSKFIAKYWKDVVYTPPFSIITTIRRSVLHHVPDLTYKRGQTDQQVMDMVANMLDDFEKQYQNVILNWQNQVAMSQISQDDMLSNIKKLMISYEIKRNNLAQALTSSKNAEKKQAQDVENADFVISTIHSAKGLEFDNVVIYYANESDSKIDEATKRMYYVAFTRAKKSEFIFAYDTLMRPKIQSDWEKIVKDLTDKEKQAMGLDPEPDNTIIVKIHPENDIAVNIPATDNTDNSIQTVPVAETAIPADTQCTTVPVATNPILVDTRSRQAPPLTGLFL